MTAGALGGEALVHVLSEENKHLRRENRELRRRISELEDPHYLKALIAQIRDLQRRIKCLGMDKT